MAVWHGIDTVTEPENECHNDDDDILRDSMPLEGLLCILSGIIARVIHNQSDLGCLFLIA